MAGIQKRGLCILNGMVIDFLKWTCLFSNKGEEVGISIFKSLWKENIYQSPFSLFQNASILLEFY